MKKKILALAILSAIGISNADYVLKYPLEVSKGGILPNNSIAFKTLENWEIYDREISNWANIGNEYDCLSWVPLEDTIDLGDTFTQTAICKQKQERTVQDQEISSKGVVRYVGNKTKETQDINITKTREYIGTGELETWVNFANSRGLSKNFKILSWSSKGLTYIPKSSYPLKTVESIDLSFNQLTNVKGLSVGLENISNLYLRDNQLTNLEGLGNLPNIRTLQLQNNQLTHFDGLINVKKIGGDLNILNNPIANINGLKNIVVLGKVYMDTPYTGPKLAANTQFCLKNFQFAYVKKVDVCK